MATGDRRFLTGSILAIASLASCASIGGGGRDAATYRARGDHWDLRITAGTIRLRERTGPLRYDYSGELPPRQITAAGIRYEGDMVDLYVVAGLVEEHELHYVLEIADRPCTDRRGRIWPSTVTFVASDDRPTGCGGAIPPAE
jgi:hypothetical protein